MCHKSPNMNESQKFAISVTGILALGAFGFGLIGIVGWF